MEKVAGHSRPQRFGRKKRERQAMARAFVGKAVYSHPTTRATIETLHAAPNFRRICGFVMIGDIPSEATFSRAFKEFALLGTGRENPCSLGGALCEAGIGGTYQPGRHGYQGPGETHGQIAAR